LGIRRERGVRGGNPRLITVDPGPITADGKRYAGPDASLCEARASAM